MRIAQSDLRRFRSFANAMFGKRLSSLRMMVDFIPVEAACIIRAQYSGCSLVCRAYVDPEDEMLNQPVSISAEQLDRMTQENSSVEFSQVESTENGSRFTITWYRNLVRQSIECDLQSPEPLQEQSVELTTIDSRFTQALRDASHATDDGSVRYAL